MNIKVATGVINTPIWVTFLQNTFISKVSLSISAKELTAQSIMNSDAIESSVAACLSHLLLAYETHHCN